MIINCNYIESKSLIGILRIKEINLKFTQEDIDNNIRIIEDRRWGDSNFKISKNGLLLKDREYEICSSYEEIEKYAKNKILCKSPLYKSKIIRAYLFKDYYNFLIEDDFLNKEVKINYYIAIHFTKNK